jgi:hypothetical protein
MTFTTQLLSIHVPENMQQYELFSVNHATASDKRRAVFYVIRAMPSAKQRSSKHASLIKVFSVWSMSWIYNECLFVARGTREAELDNWVEFWRVDSST